MRIVRGVYPVRNFITRDNRIHSLRSPGISRANSDYLISNGVKILTIIEGAVR